jgi:hypothetical protein
MTTLSAFLFKAYDFDAVTATLRLHYSYNDGTDFTETLMFPQIIRPMGTADQAALDQAFRLIFLLAGVSYYKARVPAQLECPAFALDKITSAFLTKVYLNGLGEFAYINKIDLGDKINFAVTHAAPPQPQPLELAHHLCVPVGGGKDSIVTLEALKTTGEPITLFALGTPSGIAAPIQATIDVSELPAVTVARSLSPQLFALNKNGAYNGHVPITAILSAIAVATAIMQGFDTIVMSNEHSASAPNLRVGTHDINHQYSKSFAFEEDFAAYVTQHISPSLRYFSLLRPLSEAAITRKFATYSQYFSTFRSCNSAFRQDDKRRNRNWCCNCPKCRFVFLALAPFIDKPQLIEIFERNMLNDATQTEGFAELCGLGAFKPFECVGEIEESTLLMRKLTRMDAWKQDCVVVAVGKQFPTGNDNLDAPYESLFWLNPGHRVPEAYVALLGDKTK